MNTKVLLRKGIIMTSPGRPRIGRMGCKGLPGGSTATRAIPAIASFTRHTRSSDGRGRISGTVVGALSATVIHRN